MTNPWRQLAEARIDALIDPLDDARFWEIVKLEGATPMSPQEKRAFRSAFFDKWKALESAINTWEKKKGALPLSDDRFNDLCTYVVGLGRDTYEATLENPKLAADRAAAALFREGFFGRVLEWTKCTDSELDRALRECASPEPFLSSREVAVRELVVHPSDGLGFVVAVNAHGARIAFPAGEKELAHD
jgi:hypothetical protein